MIILAEENLPYELRSSWRARNLRLTINLQGELVVTKPWLISDRQAEEFIEQKSAWILKKRKLINEQLAKNSALRLSRDDYDRYREQARDFARQKVEQFNHLYHFSYRRIFIRDQRTRWGSCSAGKNLNYNFRIVLLPERQANYIIVHELCHLREMNHSPRFWKLVEQTIPDYQQVRKELRNII